MVNIPTWKAFLILMFCFLGCIFALPNVLPSSFLQKMPDWIPKQTVVLGLDLQGGSHLLLEVDTKSVLKDMSVSIGDTVRSVLKKEKIGYVGLASKASHSAAYVQFRLRDDQNFSKISALIRTADSALEVERQEDLILVKASSVMMDQRKRNAVEQSLEIVRRRIDESGTREPIIQRQGDGRIIVQLPGVSDPEHVKQMLGKTAKMTFRMVDVENSLESALQGAVPLDSELLMGEGEDEEKARPYLVKREVVVSGESLVDAQTTIDPEYNRPVVAFRFDSVGARKFAEATEHNIGKPFAIVLDNKVISAPRIVSAITGGAGHIEGGFTIKTANDLSLLLRAGALPAPLTVLEQRTVGPDLGADSIKMGQQATILAVVLVAAFMMLAYFFFGLIANIALVVNIIWLIGALSVLQATLTLPGIAGIALTLGMAVDANVLIYERIKEEVRNGMKPLSAIEAGYTRAMSTVTDSNMTALLGATVMYAFGTGPVKGFAVTLALGVLISMFTAISLTRLIIVYWYRWRRPKTLPI